MSEARRGSGQSRRSPCCRNGLASHVLLVELVELFLPPHEALLAEDDRVARGTPARAQAYSVPQKCSCVLGRIGMLASSPLLEHATRVGAISDRVALALLHGSLLTRNIFEGLDPSLGLARRQHARLGELGVGIGLWLENTRACTRTDECFTKSDSRPPFFLSNFQ